MGNQNKRIWMKWKRHEEGLSCLWSIAQIQLRRAFALLSLAQLWPAQWGAPILVRHEALNQCTHAVSSQPALMALPVRTKAEDRSQPLSIFVRFVIFIRDPCCFSSFSMCWTSRGSLPATHLFTTASPPHHLPSSVLDPPLSIFPTSPSKVEKMYDLCCQLLSWVSRKLIMTGSSLLCQHHTPFVTVLVSASCVWQECIKEGGWSISLYLYVCVCVCERESPCQGAAAAV